MKLNKSEQNLYIKKLIKNVKKPIQTITYMNLKNICKQNNTKNFFSFMNKK